MNFLPSTIRKFLQRSVVLGLVFVGVGMCAGVFGCTPAVTMEDQAAQTRPQGSTQGQMGVQEKLSPPVVKETSLQEQPFKLQELTVQEEQGQTTIRIKFSDPVSQYRHFSLTQRSEERRVGKECRL